MNEIPPNQPAGSAPRPEFLAWNHRDARWCVFDFEPRKPSEPTDYHRAFSKGFLFSCLSVEQELPSQAFGCPIRHVLRGRLGTISLDSLRPAVLERSEFSALKPGQLAWLDTQGRTWLVEGSK